MELKRIDRFLLKALYFIAAGLVVMQTLGQEVLVRLLFAMTFPLTVFLWLRSVRKTVTSTDAVILVTVALALVSVLLDAGIHNAALSFSYLKKVVMFSMTLLFFQTAYRFRLDRETTTFIERLLDGLVLYLAVMYFASGSQMYWLDGRVSRFLTFRMSNPNLTGMYLACLYALELCRIFKQKKRFMKLMHIAMSIFLLVCVWQTQSRNALLVTCLFTAICLWLVFRNVKNLHMGKTVSVLIAIFPALFVVIYLFVVETPWFNELLFFLVGEGKNLDSRVEIWGTAVNALKKSPVIGAYYTISGGTGSTQMHNSHLDIAASYGLPAMFLVCSLLQRYLHQHGQQYDDREKYIYILGFASLLMIGIGEGALFAGSLGIYIFVGTFLLLTGQGNASMTEGTQ